MYMFFKNTNKGTVDSFSIREKAVEISISFSWSDYFQKTLRVFKESLTFSYFSRDRGECIHAATALTSMRIIVTRQETGEK